jgi:hypothetical protein
MSQTTLHEPRHVFVHKLGEDSVFCPWAQAVVPLRKCLKCEFNNRHEFIRLEKDELRGKGLIECNYTDDVTKRVPPELTKD